MRPNGEDVLRGLQGALLSYVLPHVEDQYARSELMLMLAMLSILADEWDGTAHRLVDDNGSLRALAERGADAVGDADPGLADELRTLAAETDASVRVGELTAANERLRAAIARLGIAVEGSASLHELRGEIIAYLREDVEGRDRSLMGPRADG